MCGFRLLVYTLNGGTMVRAVNQNTIQAHFNILYMYLWLHYRWIHSLLLIQPLQ